MSRRRSHFKPSKPSLPTLRRRRFFAALVGPEYRACVATEDGNADPMLSRWVIPGERYARRKIRDYHAQIPAIGTTFAEMAVRTSIRRAHASKSIARNATCMSWCPCAELPLCLGRKRNG